MDLGMFLTKILVLATLAGNALTVLLLVAHICARPLFRRITEFLSRNALLLGFLLSAGATLGSILYAEVTGYPACILCWGQRIFMYPMMFLFALALWKKDRSIIPYALLLAVLGGAVALYQWIKEMLALYTDIALACPAVPGVPSCDRIYVDEFGYITISMFALNAFILIAFVMYASLRMKKINHG